VNIILSAWSRPGGPVAARSSVIGNEHWDDPLPLRMDGKDGFSIYRGVDILNYAEDDPASIRS